MNVNHFSYVTDINILLQSHSHYLGSDIVSSLYCIKYLQYQKIFQIKIVDLDKVYILLSTNLSL
jgi:hypothetical protein